MGTSCYWRDKMRYIVSNFAVLLFTSLLVPKGIIHSEVSKQLSLILKYELPINVLISLMKIVNLSFCFCFAST